MFVLPCGLVVEMNLGEAVGQARLVQTEVMMLGAEVVVLKVYGQKHCVPPVQQESGCGRL